MKEESKDIIVNAFCEVAKNPATMRSVLTFCCWISIITFLMFPDWKAPYATGVIFSLLAIAYRPETK